MQFLPAEMEEIPRNKETNLWLSFSPGTSLFKLVDGGRVVGFCGYYITGPTFWLGSAYIFPSCRGKGYHREMVRWRVQQARATGCKFARSRCNRLSLPSFLKEGFTPVNETKHRVLVKLELT